MHEYAGGNLALRRVVAEVNSARPDAPVVDGGQNRRGRPARVSRRLARRPVSRGTRLRVVLAGALRGVAARLDPPCPTPQALR
ncbi:hypothetical protein [Promicromonospora panici]|uniref:hypothetical protein n=1 Tax=Promicromonospora panici TaxID=2219658 RepID=UPI00101D1F0D|nr:hypothetical protein [Promicromonospora panici]